MTSAQNPWLTVARSLARASSLCCLMSCGNSAAVNSGAGGSKGAGGSTDAGGSINSGAGGASATGGTIGAAGANGVGVSGTAGASETAGGTTAGTAGLSGATPGGAGASGAASAPDKGTGGTSGAGLGGSSSGGASGTCPATVLKPGDSNRTLKVGTLSRTYVLHLPTGYAGNEPLPVVIDFHGLGGTGSQQEDSNGWRSKADSGGFIMLYPDSYNSNHSWNAGDCCEDAQQNQIDDVGFIKAMIQQIEGLACVDPKRIYASGCSNGGGMTFKVACDLADIVAAAAPVDFECVYGGPPSSPSCQGCKPARPIPITQFTNTGDTRLVPYDGGLTTLNTDCPPGASCTGMAFSSAPANFSTWQQIDGCTGSTSPLAGHAVCSTNASCQGGAQVSLCVQQGGSHCGNYSALGIVDIAWEMFQKESLP